MLHEFDHHLTPSFALPAADEPSDEDLMTEIQNGREAALESLYRRHSALLRIVVSRVVNNDADTDELLQELFIEIWSCAQTYTRSKGKAMGWIITMARRRAIDRLRKKQAYARAEGRLRESAPAEEEQMHPSTGEEAAAQDTAAIFKRLIAGLPAAQAEVVRLAYFGGLSQRDISLRTGAPLGTVKTRLELAIRKLRGEILAIGGRAAWL